VLLSFGVLGQVIWQLKLIYKSSAFTPLQVYTDGIVEDGMQWSKGDLWPVGEWADSAGSVGKVEHKDEVDDEKLEQ